MRNETDQLGRWPEPVMLDPKFQYFGVGRSDGIYDRPRNCGWVDVTGAWFDPLLHEWSRAQDAPRVCKSGKFHKRRF